MSTHDERAIAENRTCPYSPATGRHRITHSHEARASGKAADHCHFCGTSTTTILREQPALGDRQPERAT